MDNKFVLSPSFNDIVFENRNKKYGAYEIRQKYTRYTIIAVICAILFFTCGSLTWAYVQRPEEVRNWRELEVDITPPGLPPIDDQQETKPDEPKPQPELPKTTAADLGPKTAELTTEIDITHEDVTPPPGNLEAGKDPNGIEHGIGTGTPEPGCVGCKPAMDTIALPPKAPVIWCPYPPTCDELDAYLMKNMRYPQICRENGIEGTVYVEFIVDTKGNYRDVKVVRGAHPAMNTEALRVMSAMPTWTPAKDDNGELLEFIMRKPIKFQLAH